MRDLFETFWTAGEFAAADRMKLFKLAWDLVGSDHASRATSYEKFFVGPAFAVRNYNFINAPWDELHAAGRTSWAPMAPARPAQMQSPRVGNKPVDGRLS